mmetsp:Transcript_14611/g.18066  ORF Transcript_14611/g.18066 Transcript_14611/m.18066 type:complete len:139 (-) Transcript_14611:1230-1646(-)
MVVEIKINIYKIKFKHSGFLSGLGFGAYHTGMQVGEREYAFSNAGIKYHTPGKVSEECEYYDCFDLGELRQQEVNGAINKLRKEFPPGSYDLVKQNCNHFTEALADALFIGVEVPAYINRAARMGARLVRDVKIDDAH